MDIDEIIIKTFSENQNICFPIYCQREAKSFVKVLFRNGINGLMFSQEIGESETNFTSWKNGLSKLGVGKKVMKRINKPIENFLWSEEELRELEKELKSEADKIKSMKNKKTEINRRIELGRSPTTKTASEKLLRKEKRKKLHDKVVGHCSFDDSYLKMISCQSRNAESDDKHLLLSRNFQRGISWTGPEKEVNQELVEDFKTIKLRKTGRIDLFETNGAGAESDESNAISSNVENSAQQKEEEEAIGGQGGGGGGNLECDDNGNTVEKVSSPSFGENSNEELFDLSTATSVVEETQEHAITAAAAETLQVNFEKSEKETSEDVVETENRDDDDNDGGSVDYLYVFSDSNSCNSSPVKSHRFKIGVASCPYEELKKASEFNVDIKLISATAVKNPHQAMERVQGELQTFLMKGRENWYYCPLAKVLQTTNDAVSWASNNSRHL